MREFDLPMRDVNYGKLSGDLIYQWGMVNYGKQSHPTCPRPLAHIWTWTNSFYFHNLEKKSLVEEGMESDYISFPLKLSK